MKFYITDKQVSELTGTTKLMCESTATNPIYVSIYFDKDNDSLYIESKKMNNFKYCIRSMLLPTSHKYVEDWHTRFLDLAIVYYIRFINEKEYDENILILPEELSNIVEHHIHDNILKLSIINNRNMYQIRDLHNLFGDDSKHTGIIYGITSIDFDYGSCYLLDTNLLTDICNKNGYDECYIIPASINEILIIDVVTHDIRDVLDTIKDVNDGKVVKNDILLSYNLYKFNKNTKEITIVNDEQEEQ